MTFALHLPDLTGMSLSVNAKCHDCTLDACHNFVTIELLTGTARLIAYYNLVGIELLTSAEE